MIHRSVLLQEAINGLDIRTGDVFLDCTLGGGGHSEEVCKRFGSEVKLVGLDLDSVAIARSVERLAKCGCTLAAVPGSFRNLDAALDSLGIDAVDRVLFDLGLSSNQIEESGRGFTFQKDEPLVMTFAARLEAKNESTESIAGREDISDDQDQNLAKGFTARDIVNEWDEENIATVIKAYGDERYAMRIAKGIVTARSAKPIETSGELAGIIHASVPPQYRFGRIHPATRTFQALRITVNDELGALAEGLEKAFSRLTAGGRIAVISFHSGEDRIVKNYFKKLKAVGEAEVITKKPIVSGDEETEENPRARSAKLRILQKLEVVSAKMAQRKIEISSEKLQKPSAA